MIRRRAQVLSCSSRRGVVRTSRVCWGTDTATLHKGSTAAAPANTQRIIKHVGGASAAAVQLARTQACECTAAAAKVVGTVRSLCLRASGGGMACVARAATVRHLQQPSLAGWARTAQLGLRASGGRMARPSHSGLSIRARSCVARACAAARATRCRRCRSSARKKRSRPASSSTPSANATCRGSRGAQIRHPATTHGMPSRSSSRSCSPQGCSQPGRAFPEAPHALHALCT